MIVDFFMMAAYMLLSPFFIATASGLSRTPASGVRLLLPKSQVDNVPEETANEASRDVFNITLAKALINTVGFKEDPYWQQNWWKDASRNHQPAKNLRSHWKSTKTSENVAEEFRSTDETRRRVIFLFLVNDIIYHHDLWNAFFEGGSQSQYSAYVHCKQSCNQTMLKQMPTLKPVDIVPTHYCHNLVDAMVSLLKGAIADGGTKYDKFVFVSDSTLPVKPFNEIFHVLGQNGESDICVFPTDHWAEAAFNEKRVVLVKHHQWVVLNYEHAKVMVKTWGSVDSQGQWSVPIRTPTYSEPLIYNAERFTRAPIANWCADEWAFFATVFGAIPEDGNPSINLPGFIDRKGGNKLMLNGPSTKKMQGICRTFAFWSDDLDPDVGLLAKELAKDHPQNVLSCWPSCTYRPAEVEKLSNDGLQEMRRSPFLFARKFSKAIELPEFREIILTEASTVTRASQPGSEKRVEKAADSPKRVAAPNVPNISKPIARHEKELKDLGVASESGRAKGERKGSRKEVKTRASKVDEQAKEPAAKIQEETAAERQEELRKPRRVLRSEDSQQRTDNAPVDMDESEWTHVNSRLEDALSESFR